MKDGSVRFNPGALNPDIVRPAGPVDPEVGILLVEPAREGPPIAGLTVFAMHLDTTGGTEYSADYPYYLETVLKGALGPRFISLFGAGTCGDINHIDVSKRDRLRAEDLGKALAETVLAAGASWLRSAHQRLDVLSTQVTCDLQKPDALEIADARAKADLITTSKLPFLERVKVAKILDLLERYPEPSCSMEVQAFKLGPELAIITLPGEVFVELGLAIKSRSPFETTLVVELANDVPNYIPTAKAFREGSYEVVNSRLAPGSGEQLVAAAVRLLRELDLIRAVIGGRRVMRRVALPLMILALRPGRLLLRLSCCLVSGRAVRLPRRGALLLPTLLSGSAGVAGRAMAALGSRAERRPAVPGQPDGRGALPRQAGLWPVPYAWVRGCT